MYYNIRNQELINSVPLNGYFEDGTLVQGLDLADFEIQKLCGILPVKSDSPNQPENTTEDITQRNIIIEDDGVIVIRTWIQQQVEQPIIPASISPRQIRLWLIENNISLTSVENAINSIVSENLREKTLVEWEYSPYVERNHPMIDTLGQILGLNSSQIDQAFIEAVQL